MYQTTRIPSEHHILGRTTGWPIWLALALFVAVGTIGSPRAMAQAAPRVTPSMLTLDAGRDRQSVTMEGRGLATYTSARVLDMEGRDVVAISADLGGTRRGQRILWFSTNGATAGEYAVELYAGRTAVPLSLSLRVKTLLEPPQLLDMTLDATVVEAGAVVTATVRLDKAAAEAVAISVTSSDPSIAGVPATVDIGPGESEVSFPIDAVGSDADVGVALEVALDRSTVTADLTVLALPDSPPQLLEFSPSGARLQAEFGGRIDPAGQADHGESADTDGASCDDLGGTMSGDTCHLQSPGLIINPTDTVNIMVGMTVSVNTMVSIHNLGVLNNYGAIDIITNAKMENGWEGVINNYGTITLHDVSAFDNMGGGGLNNHGAMVLDNGSRLNNDFYAQIDNYGTLEIGPSSKCSNTGVVANASDGTIDNSGAFINKIGGTFSNHGTLTIRPDGQVNNTGGSTIYNAGTITVEPDGSMTNYAIFHNDCTGVINGTTSATPIDVCESE
ncbi:hypothetical protein ACFL6X_06525 [Candidatus Latescibacterota bacterium]